MAKRGKLEIIRDILEIIRESKNAIKPTPLLRRSNLSSSRFKEYYEDLVKRNFIIVVKNHSSKQFSLTKKGYAFLEKYKTIVSFIDEFEL